VTPHPDEQARELAEWLHEKLCCAQNLPWEEGDICDDCVESVNTDVLPLLARVRLAEAEVIKETVQEEFDRQVEAGPTPERVALSWVLGRCREHIASLRQAAGEGTQP